MNNRPSPTQGETLSWLIIQAIDTLEELSTAQAFIIALQELIINTTKTIDDDLYQLLDAYLDRDPRGKIAQANEFLEQARKGIGSLSLK